MFTEQTIFVTPIPPSIVKYEKIFADLSSNDYPRHWLLRTYNSIMLKISTSAASSQSSSDKSIYISLPYFPLLSEKISSILRRYNICTAFRPQRRIFSFFNNHLPPFIPNESVGVVYKIDCSKCKATYIGETSRSLCTRISEHKRSLRCSSNLSKLVLHAIENDHPPDFANVQILSSNAKNYKSRIFLEGWNTHLNPNSINDAAQVPGEYLLLCRP